MTEVTVPAPSVEPPLALLLDDNLMSVMRIEPQLRRMGWRVETRRGLADVNQAADSASLRLILINLGSRGINGVQLITACKERYPAARVVGFCGHLEVDIRRQAKAAGIDKLLTNEQALSDLQQAL